jgi:hypothetical protein
MYLEWFAMLLGGALGALIIMYIASSLGTLVMVQFMGYTRKAYALGSLIAAISSGYILYLGTGFERQFFISYPVYLAALAFWLWRDFRKLSREQAKEK